MRKPIVLAHSFRHLLSAVLLDDQSLGATLRGKTILTVTLLRYSLMLSMLIAALMLAGMYDGA